MRESNAIIAIVDAEFVETLKQRVGSTACGEVFIPTNTWADGKPYDAQACKRAGMFVETSSSLRGRSVLNSKPPGPRPLTEDTSERPRGSNDYRPACAE